MKRLLITAAALCALAGAAHAQEQRQPPNYDANHDSKVTWDEYKAGQAQRTQRMFARMDANHDGKITAAEMEAARAQMAARRGDGAGPPPGVRGGPPGGFLAMMDTNKDGAVSKAEFEAASKRRFDMADTNHDGWLSKGELILMRQRMGGGGPGGPGGGEER